MRLLIDTHALLWFALNDARLSSTAHSLVADEGNEVLVSPASLWEIAIKISIGKYTLGEDLGQFWNRESLKNDLTLLPISAAHAAAVGALPFHHRDPFDRMLLAQAIVEAIPVVSADSRFDSYAIARLW